MQDDDKRAAAEAAVEEIRAGMLIGLGTGSTARFAIEAVGRMVRDGLVIRAVATSDASARQARALGIEVLDFAGVERVDLTIDGADEIDDRCRAIKGAGGAMLREKTVAAASRRMIVIADGSKQVARLGGVPVPVEILPFACASVLKALGGGLMGGEPVLRLADGEPYRTDNGNWIADVRYQLDDPAAIALRLGAIPGVLGHGLFLDEVDAAYVACRSVVTRLERIAPPG